MKFFNFFKKTKVHADYIPLTMDDDDLGSKKQSFLNHKLSAGKNKNVL